MWTIGYGTNIIRLSQAEKTGLNQTVGHFPRMRKEKNATQTNYPMLTHSIHNLVEGGGEVVGMVNFLPLPVVCEWGKREKSCWFRCIQSHWQFNFLPAFCTLNKHTAHGRGVKAPMGDRPYNELAMTGTHRRQKRICNFSTDKDAFSWNVWSPCVKAVCRCFPFGSLGSFSLTWWGWHQTVIAEAHWGFF